MKFQDRLSSILFTSRPLLILAAFTLATAVFAKTVTLTLVDSKTSICLIEGDTLLVDLPSSTAGTYRWDLMDFVKPSSLSMEREFTKPGPATNEQSFRFNAAAAGMTTLTLNYNPHAATTAPREAAQTFSVDVTVASGEPKSMVRIGTYQGTTACADCTGIETRLKLYAKGRYDFTEAIFLSTRTYRGGKMGDQNFTERGEWSLMKGDATDSNATVYALNPNQSDRAQYLLLQAGGASLIQLDKDLKLSSAPDMYQMILKKID